MAWYISVSLIFIFFCACRCDYIANFQVQNDLSLWKELSDTKMKEGKSKASFVLQETDVFRRAILFTLLNPQNCGAALAGFKKTVKLNIIPFQKLVIKCRGQGQYRGYEVFLRHKGQTGMEVPSYVHYFEAPNEFDVITLSISNFKPYSKGKLLEPPEAEPLDKTDITSFGILAYGGLNKQRKQNGAASLEIDWIKLE